MFCLLICMCNMHAPGAYRGQKRALDPLDLKVHVDNRNGSRSSARATTLSIIESPLKPNLW